MKILYVVPGLESKGGVQNLAKDVYAELKNKLDLEIASWHYDLNQCFKGLIKYLPPKISVPLYSHFGTSHFQKKISVNGFDLIHFWGIDGAIDFLKTKYIVSCYGKEILKANVRGYRQEFYPKVLDKAALIHAISQYTKNLIVKNFSINPKKIKVIPPVIDFEKFSKIKKKARKKRIIFGTLTRFNQRKNIPNIVKALEILQEEFNQDFIYYLAGEGEEKEKILNALKTVKFKWKYFGEISEEKKIKNFYPSLDVFVMPTLELLDDIEGFGIVYLEANAYGIPVVASKAGGTPEAVKENISGLFADPTDPDDIADKISKVLKNKDKYYQPAKDWAKKFDKKLIAQDFARLYRQIDK